VLFLHRIEALVLPKILAISIDEAPLEANDSRIPKSSFVHTLLLDDKPDLTGFFK
jgi:hypothetical protein